MPNAVQSAADDEKAPEYKYWAFISYSHQDNQWAAWFHKGLETYRVPQGLVGREERDFPVPKKIFPIFRDREELPTSADLGQQINLALRQSRYLIVICSPRAATSLWVNEEIKYFKALGREGQVLAVIVDGEPNASDKPDCPLPECLPAALRYRIGPDGESTGERTEPIAADAREDKDGKVNAKLKLIAGVLGVNFDALKQREKQRRRRNLTIGLSLASLLFMIISTLGVVSFVKWQESARRLVEANHNLGLVFNEKATMAGKGFQWNKSRLYSLLALARLAPGRDPLEQGQACYRLIDQAHLPMNAEARLQSTCTVAFSPDGRLRASGCRDGTVRLWDAASHQVLATLIGHGTSSSIESVAFSPDGRLLASGSEDKTVRLWDVSSRQVLATLTGHEGMVRSVAFSPDGRLLASGAGDKTVCLWDVASRQVLTTLTGHGDSVTSVAWSPDGLVLAAATRNNQIYLWDVSSRQILGTLVGGDVRGAGSWEDFKASPDLVFSPNGRVLVIASEDGTELALWDVSTRQILAILLGKNEVARSFAFSPDGRVLASDSNSKVESPWDMDRRRSLANFAGLVSRMERPAFPTNGESVALSPDGQFLSSASDNAAVRPWDISTRQVRALLTEHGILVNGVAFSPDGRMLASASEDKTVRLWDLSSRQVVANLTGHDDGICGVAFSPDGRVLASASRDKTVRLWDVSTRQILTTFTGHEDYVRSVAFSPDGRVLACASHKTVNLWDLTSLQVITTLTAHNESVYLVAFSPDNRRLACASKDHTMTLWDLANRQVVAILSIFPGRGMNQVERLTFSRDGRFLGAVNMVQNILLWDLVPLSDRRPWPERIAEAERQYQLRLVGLDLKPIHP